MGSEDGGGIILSTRLDKIIFTRISCMTVDMKIAEFENSIDPDEAAQNDTVCPLVFEFSI